MAARAKKEKPAAGPDDLVRESAGLYRSGDGRFEVQKSDVGWYLVDAQQANEFGQQLIHGPFPTLEAIRESIPVSRDLKPLLRGRKTSTRKGSAAATAVPKSPPPPPRSWIDEMPNKEGEQVRRLIRLLEKEGLSDAEGLAKRFGDQPKTLATRVVEQRLRALIDEQPEADRERAQHLVRQVVEILTTEGMTVPQPGPRWALVTVEANDGQPRDRMRPEIWKSRRPEGRRPRN